MLYCKKCERYRGHYSHPKKMVCCGCGLQIPIEIEGGDKDGKIFEK